MQEALKKYGVWIAAGALVLYLVFRNARPGASRPSITGAGGSGGEQYRLESERLRQSGMLDIERLRINAQLEAERIRQAQRQFDINAQLEAARRARETQERGQTLGAIGQIANAISGLFKGQQSQQRPQPSTPSTFPGGGTNPGQRTQLPPAPSYPIPEPSIGNVFYDPQYVPDWPAPPTDYPLSVTDWGESPQFSSGGMDVDTGASFYDQYYDVGGGDDFNYGYGYDQSSYDIYSDLPAVSDYVDYGSGGAGGGSMDDLYDYYEDFGAWGGEYAG